MKIFQAERNRKVSIELVDRFFFLLNDDYPKRA